TAPRPTEPPTFALVPLPGTIDRTAGDGFAITATTQILGTGDPVIRRIAASLAERIRRATGVAVAMPAGADVPPGPGIALVLQDGSGLGDEGYDLTISPGGVRLQAARPAGLFYGTQTLRQLLPSWGEYEALLFERPRQVVLPAVHIRDAPRYQWRGAMLDVARHFFSVDEVKRYIDL